jgi:hypothetical protein
VLFAADGRTDLARLLAFRSASTATCTACQQTATGSGPNATTFVTTQVSGVNGVAVPYSSTDIGTILSGSCSCGGGTSFPMDAFWKLSFCYGPNTSSCASSPVPIDGVFACHGMP